MVLELRANLGRDRVGPRLRDVEVITEYLGENFGLDEGLVDIPHEAVPDAVRVGLEFDADGTSDVRFVAWLSSTSGDLA